MCETICTEMTRTLAEELAFSRAAARPEMVFDLREKFTCRLGIAFACRSVQNGGETTFCCRRNDFHMREMI